jgi:REP element-mobilizing transposase RayT
MQLDLLKNKIETRGRKRKVPVNTMGGVFHAKYNPGYKRPMDSKKALHVVLKSSKAKDSKSFKNKKNEQKIFDIIHKAAKTFGIKFYDYANGGNHLHLLLKVNDRQDYVKFIKVVTGLIARFVNKSERGCPSKTKFWDSRPFSRIVHFGNDFKKVKSYFLRNTLEALGWVKYQKRKLIKSKEWQSFWVDYCFEEIRV